GGFTACQQAVAHRGIPRQPPAAATAGGFFLRATTAPTYWEATTMTRIRTTAALTALGALWLAAPAPAGAADKPAAPPLRVLLAAAAPTRDFQFLRTLLQGDADHYELSVYL